MADKSIKLKASAMVFSRLMTAQQQLKECERHLTRASDDDDFFGGAENAYEAAKFRYDAWSYIMKVVEESI